MSILFIDLLILIKKSIKIPMIYFIFYIKLDNDFFHTAKDKTNKIKTDSGI